MFPVASIRGDEPASVPLRSRRSRLSQCWWAADNSLSGAGHLLSLELAIGFGGALELGIQSLYLDLIRLVLCGAFEVRVLLNSSLDSRIIQKQQK